MLDYFSKLWMIDLSHLTTMLYDLYDDKGPEPRDPASMFRSFLVFLMTHPEMGITKWVDAMKRTPLYTILSGFAPLDVPGVPFTISSSAFGRLAVFISNLKSKRTEKTSRRKERKVRKHLRLHPVK